jgi:glycosyltransferase involved in cell wall biosynthesis
MLQLAPPSLVVAFTTFGLATLRTMHKMEVPTVTECGSCHVEFRRRLRREERDRVGLPVENSSHRRAALARELAEYEAADHIAVPSAVAARSFIDNGVPAAKLLEIPYGVDISAFHPNLPARHDRFSVLVVGNLSIEKGTHHVVEALEQLSGRRIELICAGAMDPWMHRRLQNSRNVIWRFAGRLSPAELAREYRRASVLCLPSLHEGMSLTVLEALASGLPVIISENTGYSTIIKDGREGFVVPIRDPSTIAACIAQLQDDEDLRREMAVHARRLAEGYSWAAYGDRLDRVYRPLMVARA